jgi:hypothetical protein
MALRSLISDVSAVSVRVKSPLYGADFSDPAVLDTLIDHLIDMLLAATMLAPPVSG